MKSACMTEGKSHSGECTLRNSGIAANSCPPPPTEAGGPECDDDLGLTEITDERFMTVSVRGMEFRVGLDHCAGHPGTRLYRMSATWRGRRPGSKQVFYLDLSPAVFHCVLDYYRKGELHLPEGLCPAGVIQELEYWGIGPEVIAHCCLWKSKEVCDAKEKIDTLLTNYKSDAEDLADATTWREKLWLWYLHPLSCKWSMAMYLFGGVIFGLFLSSLAMQTFPGYRVADDSVQTHPPRNLTVFEFIHTTRPVLWLCGLDFALLLYFTLYTLVFFLVCKDKHFYLSPLNVVGMSALLVQYIPVSIDLFCWPLPAWYRATPYIEGLKVFRVVLLLVDLNSYRSMRILLGALSESKKELGILCFLIIISSLVFGYLVYLFEMIAEDTHFKSIPDGFWWGVITLTTVGYGDIYPQSVGGKVVGVACAVVGILVVALPVPIISGNFTKIYDLLDVADYHKKLKADSEKKGVKSICNDGKLDQIVPSSKQGSVNGERV